MALINSHTNDVNSLDVKVISVIRNGFYLHVELDILIMVSFLLCYIFDGCNTVRMEVLYL